MLTATTENPRASTARCLKILHRQTGDVLYLAESGTLRGADLSGAALYGADLAGADLRGADLTGTSLLGATLAQARLEKANFHRATLYGADLSGASLRGADLRQADLRAAIMVEADLSGALVAGARYATDTQWPTGFDAHAYGAVAVRARPTARRRGEPAAPVASGEVMIVEDDDGIRETLARVLRRRGFRVSTSETGQKALDRLRAGERPAVIVLDMSMPDMDGWGFRIEQLKNPELARIPVVVGSACYDPLLAAKLTRANGYLMKPYDFNAVETILRHFCEPDPENAK